MKKIYNNIIWYTISVILFILGFPFATLEIVLELVIKVLNAIIFVVNIVGDGLIVIMQELSKKLSVKD